MKPVIAPEQMPFGTVNPHEFVNQLKPAMTSSNCDWNTPWKVLYKSSKDGFNFETYKARCTGCFNTVVFIQEKKTGNVYGGYTGVARLFPQGGVYRTAAQDPDMFIFAITDDGASCTKSSSFKQYHYPTYDSNIHPFYFASDFYCQGLNSASGGSATSTFNYLDKGSWPHVGLNSTGNIQFDELEVWQIPNIDTTTATNSSSSSNAVPDIFDTTVDTTAHDDTCKLPATTTDSMTFRDDMSALATPVTALTIDLQVWLHGQLQQLDKQMTALGVDEKLISDETDFMTYHFPVNKKTNTTTTSTNTASKNSKQLLVKGVYNGIVYTVLHGELICTMQNTIKQLTTEWPADVTAADVNSDGYIVQEFDYECFRKLINVMRLKTLLKSPQCKLPSKYKETCAAAVPVCKKGMLSCMLT
jgi:hypothetical protein